MACPSYPKTGPEEIVATVNAFQGRSDKMEATDLEVNPEKTETAVRGRKL
jgi:hypothetical protein